MGGNGGANKGKKYRRHAGFEAPKSTSWIWRYARGSNNPRAKLVDTEVLAILHRLDVGERAKDIAADFGVSPAAIGHIRSGRTWRHLTGRLRPM